MKVAESSFFVAQSSTRFQQEIPLNFLLDKIRSAMDAQFAESIY